MTWAPIRSASFSVTIGGTEQTVSWHYGTGPTVPSGFKEIWFDDASALLTPVWGWQRTGNYVGVSPSMRAATVRLVSDASSAADMQELTQLCDAAIAAATPGTLTLSLGPSAQNHVNSKLRCYMVPGAVSDWYWKEGLMRQEFDVVPIDQYWYWTLGSFHASANGGRNYAVITSPLGADIDMAWESPAGADPRLTISPNEQGTAFTNVYGVNATASGAVSISTRDRAVTIDGANGFDKRIDGAKGSGSYIFEAIPAGSYVLTNDGSTECVATITQRLAAPKWQI